MNVSFKVLIRSVRSSNGEDCLFRSVITESSERTRPPVSQADPTRPDGLRGDKEEMVGRKSGEEVCRIAFQGPRRRAWPDS